MTPYRNGPLSHGVRRDRLPADNPVAALTCRLSCHSLPRLRFAHLQRESQDASRRALSSNFPLANVCVKGTGAFLFGESACQRVKKASQSLPPAGGKGILIIFCRGVYLTENTTQAASLAPQRCAERNRRRRLLARSCAICTSKAYKSCARQTAILLSKKGKALF